MVTEELKTKTLGMTASVIFHLLLLLFFVENQNTKLPIVAAGLTEKSQLVSVTLIPIAETEKQERTVQIKDIGDKIVYPADLDICKDDNLKYEGIGIIYSPMTRTIMSAPEYYPGYKAGLRVGDFIMNLEDPAVDGFVILRILRNRNEYTFKIKVEKICYVNS